MKLLFATVVALSLAAPAAAAAAPGDLDPSFGGGAGWVRTLEVRDAASNYLPGGAEDVLVQPDGKVVVTGPVIDGRSNRYFGALRHLPDGSLDPGFGSGGLVAADLGSFEDPRAVALQRDGKIVVAGETDCETARCFAAMRLHPDGTPDTGFGAGGVVRVPFHLRAGWANDVAIDGAGRIVLAGVRLRGGDAQDTATVCVIRLLPDGRPDPGFSGDGVAVVDHGYGNDSAEAVLLRRGKVVVAGEGRVASGRSRFGIARLRADGRLDRSFGRRGRRLVSFGARRLATAYALAAAPRGRIVVAGSAVVEGGAPQFALARLTRGGAVDRRTRTSPGPFGGYAKAVRATRGGFLVAGRAYTEPGTGSSDWALARYGAGGRLDRGFGGGDGIVTTDFGTGEDRAEAIALTPGRATAAGSIYGSHGLARYVTD
jgi:uncharacterized delta-60 repeat protein